MNGVQKIARLSGFGLDEISAVAHGTTTATNAVLQRDFGRLGLVVTRGFRHVLEIARQSVPDGYGNSYFWVKPPRLVTLERVCEVGGRLDFGGEELEPLAEEDVHSAAATFRRRGVDCIAVCLLHSYASSAHELRVGELLEELLPDAFVSLSSTVLPEYREYERAMTTILDALVKPFTGTYLRRATEKLHGEVGPVPFLIMQSNGGVVSAGEVGRAPITTLFSGPAAGVLGASFVAELAGYRNLLTLDAGGTSTDVCLVEDLRPNLTTEAKVEQYPVKSPMLDIVAVGTGGGSVAWIGPQSVLKVGPQSAGAVPGPMCYGQGGEQPTITDANLVLGRIPPHLLGGEVPLNTDAARRGIAAVGDALGLGLEETAAGILEIAAWNQAHGIRQVTVQRGRDPSDYCLVAFGGSGALLAGEVADILEISTVLVPLNPGNLSAFGLQASDIRRDYVRTLVRSEESAEAPELEAAWAELEAWGREDLMAEGVPPDAIELRRSVDARYVGEAHEVQVHLEPALRGENALAAVWERFHDVHERTFGFAYRGEQLVEIVNLRVQAVGEVHRPQLREGEPAATPVATAAGERPVYVGDEWVGCPIYARSDLEPGMQLDAPAVVEEFGSTTVAFPGWTARVDGYENLVMERVV
jgi:N-methylhydantoinase A